MGLLGGKLTPNFQRRFWLLSPVVQIMTDKLPYPELQSGAAIVRRVIEGKVPAAAEDEHLSQIARLCSLMTDCWILDPRDRPSASRCCDEVKWVVRSFSSIALHFPQILTLI